MKRTIPNKKAFVNLQLLSNLSYKLLKLYIFCCKILFNHELTFIASNIENKNKKDKIYNIFLSENKTNIDMVSFFFSVLKSFMNNINSYAVKTLKLQNLDVLDKFLLEKLKNNRFKVYLDFDKNLKLCIEFPKLLSKSLPTFNIPRDLLSIKTFTNPLKTCKCYLEINDEVYKVIMTTVDCTNSDTLMLYPQFILPLNTYSNNYVLYRSKKMHIYGYSFVIRYIEYQNYNNNNFIKNFKPYFIQKYKKYPVFIYIIALILYVSSSREKKSQKDVCDFMKSYFGLENFHPSTISRLLRGYSILLNIDKFSKLSENLIKVHDTVLKFAFRRPNLSLVREYTHCMFRRVYMSHIFAVRTNFTSFAESESTIISCGFVDAELSETSPELFKTIDEKNKDMNYGMS
jgi:hypothetical protein